MSAITGIYHLNDEPISSDDCIKIMEGLNKFPADYRHIWKKDSLFFGCIGQCITLESAFERLPYYDTQRQIVITADAIIDNRQELFERLQIDYSVRNTMTDSELIIHAYEKWGEHSPTYLIGDFSFMIWDMKKQMLFGARDLSGMRTLYYFKNERRFAFCSIIEPLLTLPYVSKDFNEQWLAEFLAIPSMVDSTDTSSSVYMQINQVPPAHKIIVKGGNVSISRYGSFIPNEELYFKTNLEYEEAFIDVFQEAVNSKIRTNKKVGSQLSGGLDSGSVVSFAAPSLKEQNKSLYTFSYVPVDGFVDWTPKRGIANESPYIKSTVEHVGNIKENYLDFLGKNPFTEIDEWLELLEMPYKFFENTFWIKGIYEKANELDIGILLSGARGNFSISFGPSIDYYALLLKQFKWVKLYQEIGLFSNNREISRKRLLSLIKNRAYPNVNQVKGLQDSDNDPVLINQHLAKRTQVFSKLLEQGIDVNNISNSDAFESRKNHFEKTYYWNKSGTVGTKLSLRYGLWERDPTNDPRVIRYCLAIPTEQYIQKGIDRSLIRRATKNYLPEKVRMNQNIRGMQSADWLHRMIPIWNDVSEELKELTKDPLAAEYLNIDVIKSAIKKMSKTPYPELANDSDLRVAMRGLIFNRFIKKRS
ncbi:asparagine synthase-related protein [Metabacillus halosaccharovorans]|uniref:asparagine synthase-related protein n=1 Tax=Metabacillus halosaccharovorans TaxID=930124 RepID=UPI003735A0CA